jgi:hypothetical protein
MMVRYSSWRLRPRAQRQERGRRGRDRHSGEGARDSGATRSGSAGGRRGRRPLPRLRCRSHRGCDGVSGVWPGRCQSARACALCGSELPSPWEPCRARGRCRRAVKDAAANRGTRQARHPVGLGKTTPAPPAAEVTPGALRRHSWPLTRAYVARRRASNAASSPDSTALSACSATRSRPTVTTAATRPWST